MYIFCSTTYMSIIDLRNYNMYTRNAQYLLMLMKNFCNLALNLIDSKLISNLTCIDITNCGLIKD